MKVKSNKFSQAPRVLDYDRRLDLAARAVGHLLYDNTWKDTPYVITVSARFAMEAIGISRPTFYKAINTLMDTGYIVERVSQTLADGTTTCPKYTLAEMDGVEAEVSDECMRRFKNDKEAVIEEKVETPIVESKEESKVVKKPVKRTLKKVDKTTPPAEKQPSPKKVKPDTSKDSVFTRGYENTSHTEIPKSGADITEWSGYDGTALAERDHVRGPLKNGKRVYTVRGKKYTIVMEKDGETANFFASEIDFKRDLLRYLRIPHYTRDQWIDIVNTWKGRN